MSNSLDTNRLAELIKAKRGNKGLRQLSAEINISPSTLSRIEQGNLPDIDTYIRLCEWLNVSTDFFTSNQVQKNNTQTGVIAHLRADKTLSPNTAEALIQMINLAYASATKEN